MQISAIRNNSYNYNFQRKNVSAPNFRGELSAQTLRRVLTMLKPTVSEVITAKSMNDLKPVMDTLAARYATKGLGLTIIPRENLSEFSGLAQEMLTAKLGLCISAGDKLGPVETWSKAFESKLVLLPANMS